MQKILEPLLPDQRSVSMATMIYEPPTPSFRRREEYLIVKVTLYRAVHACLFLVEQLSLPLGLHDYMV